jgi:hypothetical protein
MTELLPQAWAKGETVKLNELDVENAGARTEQPWPSPSSRSDGAAAAVPTVNCRRGRGVAQEAITDGVTVREAARRLGTSRYWFRL